MASPLIQFRAINKSLANDLEQRSEVGKSASDIAERDLERYYYMLKFALAKLPFSMGEAMLLCDVMNGTIIEPYSASLLWASVSDGVDEGRAEYWKQYHPELDGAKLIAKLKALSPFECMAVADAIERAWNSETYQVANMEERVRQVGLVRE
jgi:hypothetical protein